jgi:hypothetical protein
MVYLALFGIGRLIFGALLAGLSLILGAVACAAALSINLRGIWGEHPELFPTGCKQILD